jgi:hypothetical protein
MQIAQDNSETTRRLITLLQSNYESYDIIRNKEGTPSSNGVV